MATDKLETINRRYIAIFILIIVTLVGLGRFFDFLRAQAAGLPSQDAPETVSLIPTLILDVNSKTPVMTYTLEINAPSEWDELADFQDKQPGTLTYTQTMDKILYKTGIKSINFPVYFEKMENKGEVEPGRISLLFTKTIPVYINKSDEPKKPIDLPVPFGANLENRDLKISFMPWTISSTFGITASVILKGVDVNYPWRDLSYGNYVDDTLFGLEAAHVYWKIPAGDATREEDGFSITLPCLFIQKIIRETYNSQIENTVVLTSTIALNASDLGRQSPFQGSTMVLKAPRDWPYVDGLRINQSQQSTNPKELEAFLCTITSLENVNLAQMLGSGLITLSNFNIDKNNVSLTLSNQSGQVFFPDDPYSVKDILGQFAIAQWGEQLVINIGDLNSQSHPWVRRVVNLTVTGVDVLSTSLPPVSDNGKGNLTWIIPANSKLGDIIVETTLPFTPFLRQLQISLGGWYWIVGLLNDFFGITVVLVLIWILSGHNQIMSSDFTSKVHDQRHILLNLVILLVTIRLLIPTLNLMHLIINNNIYNENNLISSFLEQLKSYPLPLLLSLLTLSFSLITLILFINYTIQIPNHRKLYLFAWESRRSRIINWILLGFAGFLLIFLEFILMSQYDYIYQKYLRLLLPLEGLLFLLITIFLVAGLFQLFISLITGDSTTGTDEQSKQRLRTYQWIIFLFSIAIICQWVYVRTPEFLNPENSSAIAYNLFNYPNEFTSQLLYLIPIVALVGLASLLHQIGRDANSPIFTDQQRWVIKVACLLYAGFVVNKTLSIDGILLPLGLIIAYFVLTRLLSNTRSSKLKEAQEWIDNNNPAEPNSKKPLMVCYHRQLLERAEEIEVLESQKGDLYTKHIRKEITKEDYNTQLDDLISKIKTQKFGNSASIAVPQTELLPESTKADIPNKLEQIINESNEKTLINLPHWGSPKEIVLGSGPKINWWKNGYQALNFGLWLAILPIGYYIYVLATERAKLILSSYNFGVISIILSIVNETAFWLVAAFVMGLLFPYLWGKNGAIRGAFLAGVYAITIWIIVFIQRWLNLGQSPDWLFRTLQLLLYLIVLGVLMDWNNLVENNRYWRALLDLYELKNARVLAGYLTPLILTVLGIILQIKSGAAALSIITEILKGLNTVLINPQ